MAKKAKQAPNSAAEPNYELQDGDITIPTLAKLSRMSDSYIQRLARHGEIEAHWTVMNHTRCQVVNREEAQRFLASRNLDLNLLEADAEANQTNPDEPGTELAKPMVTAINPGVINVLRKEMGLVTRTNETWGAAVLEDNKELRRSVAEKRTEITNLRRELNRLKKQYNDKAKQVDQLKNELTKAEPKRTETPNSPINVNLGDPSFTVLRSMQF